MNLGKILRLITKAPADKEERREEVKEEVKEVSKK